MGGVMTMKKMWNNLNIDKIDSCILDGQCDAIVGYELCTISYFR